jgi:ATP-dependent Clp protease ATP-binding subunit ClpA
VKKGSYWQDSLQSVGAKALIKVFDEGILKPDEDAIFKTYGEALLKTSNLSEPVEPRNLRNINEAAAEIQTLLSEQLSQNFADFLGPKLVSRLEHNIFYDKAVTEKYLESQLEGLRCG